MMLLQTTNVVVVILSCAFIGSLPTPVEAGGSSSAGEFVDSGHLIWTTIAQTSRSEVDMWTKTSSGCPCNSNNATTSTTSGSKNNNKHKDNNKELSKACACCAHQGACQCGPKTPYRCAQCGLEQHCDQMCNVTLDASQLYAASKLRYGQIKSLELQENQVCWYRLVPEPGFRIELQIYRLVDTGQLTNQSKGNLKCNGGRLEWMTSGGLRLTSESSSSSSSSTSSQGYDTHSHWPVVPSVMMPTAGNYQQHLWTLCGPNERYSPPVLLFSDDDISPATLVLKSGESTRRGKLLAHFSFTPIEHSAPLGLQIVGATAAHGSDCDWHYQQSDCLSGAKYNNTCRMASPGYPGLYPPGRTCRYHIAIQSPFQPLTLQFTSVQLPPQRCRTDNVRVYINGRLHSTLCGQQMLQLSTHGPDIVVEFNSGPLRSPYVFNGFMAQMSFRAISPDDSQPQPPTSPTHQQRHHPPPPTAGVILPTDIPNGAFRAMERQAHAVCDYVIKPVMAMRTDASSDRARWSGFFSTSITAWKVWPAPCSFTFPAQQGQSVQLSIFTYNLTALDCTSFLDIHEGGGGVGVGGGLNDARWNPNTRRQQICSPVWKKSRNSYSKFNQPFLIQSNNNASLSLRFRMDPQTGADQIIEGAFVYYDEFDGQRRAGTLCDTAYDGLNSPSQGFYIHGFDTAVFWPVTGPFNCSSIFTPRDGQTITITIVDSVMKDGDGRCYTDCDRYGCHCRTNSTSVVDRVTVSLAHDSRSQLVCLCGDIQAFLPLSLTSNAALSVHQYVNEFTYGQKDLRVQFGYSFSERRQAECGHDLRIDSVSGSIKPLYFGLTDKSINQMEGYHHTDCLWVAGIKPTEQWVATVTPPSQGQCEDWNMTFHHYDEAWPSRLGDVLDLICPSKEKRVFAMPTVVKIVAIRLQAWGTTPVEYRLDWQTLFLPPRPTPATAAGVQRSLSSLITTPVPAVANAPPDAATPIAKSDAAACIARAFLLHQSYTFLAFMFAVLSLRFQLV